MSRQRRLPPDGPDPDEPEDKDLNDLIAETYTRLGRVAERAVVVALIEAGLPDEMQRGALYKFLMTRVREWGRTRRTDGLTNRIKLSARDEDGHRLTDAPEQVSFAEAMESWGEKIDNVEELVMAAITEGHAWFKLHNQLDQPLVHRLAACGATIPRQWYGRSSKHWRG